MIVYDQTSAILAHAICFFDPFSTVSAATEENGIVNVRAMQVERGQYTNKVVESTNHLLVRMKAIRPPVF